MNILDDAARMGARSSLENAGCDVIGIDSAKNGLQVRVKRGSYSDFLAACSRMGATVADAHYFPIGTEQVAQEYRHDGSYPGSRGFTFNALVAFPVTSFVRAAQ